MSSQKGNVQKSGPPKHKNRMVFKNNLHDTNKRTQAIRGLTIAGVCARCKDIVDWKIKYKKYKPLTQPKKCVKCGEKRVKKAYYVVCEPCTKTHNICAKCAKPGEIVVQPGLTPAEEAREQSELDYQLQQLPERKRRAFYRSLKSKKTGDGEPADEQEGSEEDNSEGEDSDDESTDEVNQEEKTDNVSDNMKDLELSAQLNNDFKDIGSSGVAEDKIVHVVRKIDEKVSVEDQELPAQSVSDSTPEIQQSANNSGPESLIDINASKTIDDQVNNSTQNPNDACMSTTTCECVADSGTAVSCECSHSCEHCYKTCGKSLVVEKLL